MGDGLISPKTVNAIKKYREDLDNAGSSPKVAPEKDEPVVATASKPITAAEARAKKAEWDARDAAEAAKAKGMPKPSLMDRAKKLVGL